MKPATSPEHTLEFELAARTIVEAGQRIHMRGWSPATSSNYSLRLGKDHCAITVSGRDKGALSVDDIMCVDLQGRALGRQKPSAETLLHTALYRRKPDTGAVLHTHSVFSTLVSMRAGETVEFAGLEILKAFRGMESHEGSMSVPVFDNTQDISALATEVDAWMESDGSGHAYLIRGHGLYTWGEDMAEAMRHLEALEFLLEYTWHRQGVHI